MYERFFAARTELMKASEIRELLKLTRRPDIISLAGGLPDPKLFPKEEIARIAKEVLEQQGELALQYSATRGVPELLEQLSKFLAEDGIRASPSEIMVTSGSQQALDLIARTLMDKDDVVVVELPTYLAAINAFKPYQPRLLGVPMDDDGMKIDALQELLSKLKQEGRKVKLVYTIPTCQNPSGVTMSMDRRKALLDLAEDYDFLILEDNPYSYFMFEERDVKHIKALDKNGRVIYTSTMSKILAPGLRVGWIVAHEDLVQMFELAKQAMDLHTATLTQMIAAKAIEEGLVRKHVEKMKGVYKGKRDAMLKALDTYMPEQCRWTKPVGGFFVFLFAPEGIDTKQMLPKAVEKGVAYVPGQAFYVDGSGANTMRLNYSYPSIEQIEEGIKRLAEVIAEEIKALRS